MASYEEGVKVHDGGVYRVKLSPYINCLSAEQCGRHCTALSLHYCRAGNFRGRKLLQILRFCGYLQKFSLGYLGMWHFLAAIRERFLMLIMLLCKCNYWLLFKETTLHNVMKELGRL